MAEPLLIDRFMPEYDLAIVYSRVYRASPERCFETVVNADLLRTPLIRLLIGARGVPVAIAERLRGEPRPREQPTFRLRDMPSIGWVVLGERPGRELVQGDITKPWAGVATRPRTPITSETFAGFDVPGYTKIVESTRTDPYGERASVLTLETRVLSTDERAKRLFRLYWLGVGPFSHLIRRSALRRFVRELG